MKHTIIILLSILAVSLSYGTPNGFKKANSIVILGNSESSHRGSMWTIKSGGTIVKGKILNAETIKSNTITVKWNISNGRMAVTCNEYCSESDEFLIRLFDKDSLRIDWVAWNIQPNTYLADSSYIVPASVRREISYMEIRSTDEDWHPEYSVICKDGYDLRYESYADEDYRIRPILELFTSSCQKQTSEVQYKPLRPSDNEEINEPNTETTIDNTKKCPDGYYQHNNNCYCYSSSCGQSPQKLLAHTTGELPENCWGDPKGDVFCD